MQFNYQVVQASEVSLAYVEQGRGDPVIFLHGSGPTDLRTWAAQIEPFAARYHAIAYSRRYHYPNPWVGDGSDVNSLHAHAADLAALIAALELGRVHLVGLSFGADIALRFAVDNPRLLRTVVLAEPALFSWLVTLPGGAEMFAGFARAIVPAKAAVRDGEVETGMRLWLDSFMGSGALDQLPAATVDRIKANIRLLSFEPTALSDITGEITREEAVAIRAPVLLLAGEESPPMFKLVMDELERHLPQTERVEIARASHLLHSMNPVDFNTAVLTFLGQQTGQATSSQ